MSAALSALERRERAERMTLALRQLASEFERLNLEHFAGKLSPPKIEFSTRKSFGGYYQKREHRIVLSWQAFDEYGWDETLNTFRHEVAHIVHLHHRAEFWLLARQLGVTRKYARHPLRPKAQKVLVYECPSCHRQILRQRRLKNSSCARCDKRYNPAFRLRLIAEETRPVPEKQER